MLCKELTDSTFELNLNMSQK